MQFNAPQGDNGLGNHTRSAIWPKSENGSHSPMLVTIPPLSIPVLPRPMPLFKADIVATEEVRTCDA